MYIGVYIGVPLSWENAIAAKKARASSHPHFRAQGAGLVVAPFLPAGLVM